METTRKKLFSPTMRLKNWFGNIALISYLEFSNLFQLPFAKFYKSLWKATSRRGVFTKWESPIWKLCKEMQEKFKPVVCTWLSFFWQAWMALNIYSLFPQIPWFCGALFLSLRAAVITSFIFHFSSPLLHLRNGKSDTRFEILIGNPWWSYINCILRAQL